MTARKLKSTEKYTLQNIKWLFDSGKLNLNPEYQRGSVWATSQNQLLVDSVLRDVDVPKLYFRRSKPPHEFEVVDGQQRIRAIVGFIDNSFKISEDADSLEGIEISGKTFSTLDTPTQMKLLNSQFDIVVLNESYSDEDIEDMFLRLQNGTPLNAQEKRRAIPGAFRDVVAELAQHDVFHLCAFKNTRFAYEDAVAKILHIALHGDMTDIKPTSIRRTYTSYQTITAKDASVTKVRNAFNFIKKSFSKRQSPGLKKYSILTVTHLVMYLQDTYVTPDPDAFALAYLEFEVGRIQNDGLSEETRDAVLSSYTNAARSDSISDMSFRSNTLRNWVVSKLVDLTLKDPMRGFTDEQRRAIFFLNNGICQTCGTPCSEDEFHADHKIPHSKGGQTKISNGQVLCPLCNLKKGAR